MVTHIFEASDVIKKFQLLSFNNLLKLLAFSYVTRNVWCLTAKMPEKVNGFRFDVYEYSGFYVDLIMRFHMLSDSADLKDSWAIWPRKEIIRWTLSIMYLLLCDVNDFIIWGNLCVHHYSFLAIESFSSEIKMFPGSRDSSFQ